MEFYILVGYILAYIGLLATSFYFVNLLSYYRKPQPKTDKLRSVTIIIPAYNEEKSIIPTIKSALRLDYPKELLEIIVVDDGSKDKTYEKALSMTSPEGSPQIRVFTKQNGGKGSALNLGISKARGDIIITMDADTFANPCALKEMVSLFYDEKVMAVTPSMGVYKPKSLWQRIQQIEYYMGVFLRKSFASMNAIHITPGAFSAYRKEFFIKHGGYDVGNITEDLEIALRIQSQGYTIENAPQAVVYTLSPSKFRPLMVQRRRWYTGLIKNLWAYKRLFGLKKGPLGYIVLPTAVTTVILSIFLTTYMVVKTLFNLKDELLSLQTINFNFDNWFEINSFLFEKYFYTIFSKPIFVLSLAFILLLISYLFFSRQQMRYKEGLKLNFALFLAFYSLLFSFWWIVSIFYVIFNRKVVWREEKHGT